MVQARQCVGFVKKHMALSRWSHTPAPGPVGGVNASLHPARKSGTVDITSKKFMWRHTKCERVCYGINYICEFGILSHIPTDKPLGCITTTDNWTFYTVKQTSRLAFWIFFLQWSLNAPRIRILWRGTSCLSSQLPSQLQLPWPSTPLCPSKMPFGSVSGVFCVSPDCYDVSGSPSSRSCCAGGVSPGHLNQQIPLAVC